MYRTKTCGELRLVDVGKAVILSGWIQVVRDLGAMLFVDLRDRYGITQLSFFENKYGELTREAKLLGREFVVQVQGEVLERSSKNTELPTGEIEVQVSQLTILNESKLPPFLIDEKTDGGEELRMKYRYLDLRRPPMQRNLTLRHKVTLETRLFLSRLNFLEIETPFLIKTTPEGAKDFVVPSRVHTGNFYALPQSPQIFKQLLMVSGYDRYFQIVKCFRDEDLRSDRQLEFTQIDCELSFVSKEDIYSIFEGLMRHLFASVIDVNLGEIPRMTYEEAMNKYGTDKPDLRFEIPIHTLTDLVSVDGSDFQPFNNSEAIFAISVPGMADYSRKKIDHLIDWVKKPQVGAKGLVWIKYDISGGIKSSIDRFFDKTSFQSWLDACGSKPGDMLLILFGDRSESLVRMGMLRLEVADLMNLRKARSYAALWVTDFPLLEWDEEDQRYQAMHHPFTAPLDRNLQYLDKEPQKVTAEAYDFVINGNELGGGSIRINKPDVQLRVLKSLGLSDQQITEKFGFLIEALSYGAPPHGGIALGLDRIMAILGGGTSIRDYIAFPKNNSARDVMIDAPSKITDQQLKELSIEVMTPLNP